MKDQSFVNTKASINSPQHAICEFKTPEVLTTRRQTLMTLLLEQYMSLGGEIFYQHTFKSFDQSNCEATFENNEKYSLSHLVACDGIRSSIREQFFTPNQKPRYSGYSAWRGIGKSNLQNVHFALGPGSHIVSYPINNEAMLVLWPAPKKNMNLQNPGKRRVHTMIYWMIFQSMIQRFFLSLKIQ